MISFGYKIARFRTKDNKRCFAVHEDLLCTSSEFFKAHLQKNRKTIKSECSICTEELNPKVDDVTFCDECGQNVHDGCIEKWRKSREEPTTCPMCRKVWNKKTEQCISLEHEIDIEAAKLYVDWLYTGKLSIDLEDYSIDGDACLPLLKAWTVSTVVQDTKFRYVIIATIVSNYRPDIHESGFWIQSAHYAFEDHLDLHMREFIVDSFVAYMEVYWFEDYAENFPTAFICAVSQAL